MKYVRYSVLVRTKALKLYATGYSCRAIAGMLAEEMRPSPTISMIARWATEAGIKRTMSETQYIVQNRRYGRDYVEMKKVIAFMTEEQLASATAVASKLGCTVGAVLRSTDPEYHDSRPSAQVKRYWQADSLATRERHARLEKIRELRQKKATMQEIAAELKVSMNTVQRYCWMLGMGGVIRRSRPRSVVDSVNPTS